MVHLGSLESTRGAKVTYGYRLDKLLRFFRAFQTSRVHFFFRWVYHFHTMTQVNTCRIIFDFPKKGGMVFQHFDSEFVDKIES